MPQTTDQLTETVRKALHRAYNLGQTYWQQADSESYAANKRSEETAAKFDQLSAETLAALSAVPLVAEAPREPPLPEGWATEALEAIWNAPIGTTITADMKRAASLALRVARGERWDDDSQEWGAPPVSVAPMPEEWLKEAMRLANWYARAKSCALQLCMPPTAEDSFLTNARAAVEDAEAALLSHLRTAPRPTLSDEQIKAAAVAWHDNDTLGDETCEHRFLEIIAFAAGVRWVASVAPQPEQPNTEQPHLADNGRKPVQGLDAAAGVAPAHWTPGMVDRMNSLAEELKFDTVGVALPATVEVPYTFTPEQLERNGFGTPGVGGPDVL